MIVASGHGASAGPLGLLVILLIGVVTVLLIGNMNGRLRRLPREIPDPDAAPSTPSDPPASPRLRRPRPPERPRDGVWPRRCFYFAKEAFHRGRPVRPSR